MSKERIVSAARTYWPLSIAVLVLVAGFVFGRSDANGPAADKESAAPKLVPFQQYTDYYRPSTPRKDTTAKEKANDSIAEYQQKIDAGVGKEEEIALTIAMGNLYRTKLGDLQHAAECYSWLVTHYPDDPGARAAYIHLVTCYAMLNDGENLTRLLNTMLKTFPKGTQEYLFAEKELNAR